MEAAAVPLLDDEVGVDEAVAQSLGGQHPDRAFSAGGHADEDDVGLVGGDGTIHGLSSVLRDDLILHYTTFSVVCQGKLTTNFRWRGDGDLWDFAEILCRRKNESSFGERKEINKKPHWVHEHCLYT